MKLTNILLGIVAAISLAGLLFCIFTDDYERGVKYGSMMQLQIDQEIINKQVADGTLIVSDKNENMPE